MYVCISCCLYPVHYTVRAPRLECAALFHLSISALYKLYIFIFIHRNGRKKYNNIKIAYLTLLLTFFLTYVLLYFFQNRPFPFSPCARLSWPFVTFWAHVNISYRIVSWSSVVVSDQFRAANNTRQDQQVRFFVILGRKCTLAASRAAPWWVTWSMRRKIDRRTPDCYITLQVAFSLRPSKHLALKACYGRRRRAQC